MNSKLERLNDEKKEQLINVIKDFASRYSIEEAKKYLWKLTFDPEFALLKMGLDDAELIPLNRKIRKEIIIEGNYEALEELPDVYPEELYKKLNQDPFALNVIVSKIKNFLETYDFDIERVKHLLASDDEKKYYGGLRGLGLGQGEAEFFKPAIKEISEYYNFVYEQMKIISTEEASELHDMTRENEESIEIVMLVDEENEDEIEISEEEDEQYGEESLNIKKDISAPIYLLQNKDIIEQLYNDIEEKYKGLDVIKILSKKEEILAFFNSANQLSI